MNIKLLDGVPVLSGIDVARLEIDAVCRVTGTEREGQWFCGELEFSCQLSLCQDLIRTGPGTIVWANPRAGDLDVVGDVLDGGESLDHKGREDGGRSNKGGFACMVL